MDIEKIQSQLKSHIEQHQVLIREMKKDPQNGEIRRKVELLQVELEHLNQRQKHVVQQLKRNIQPTQELSNDQHLSNHPPNLMTTGESQNKDQNKLLENSHHTIQNRINKPIPDLPINLPKLAASKPAPLNHQRSNPTINTPTTTTPVTFPSSPKLLTQHTNNHKTKLVQPVFKKPVMITTGMQTLPSPKPNTVRTKPVVPGRQNNKPKVSMGVQTTKPRVPNGAQDARSQDQEKLNFLSTLGLVTINKCKDIVSQKQERKRRTSAIFSPYSSFQFFEPEPKKAALSTKRGRGRPPKNGEVNSPSLPNCTSTFNGFSIGTMDDSQKSPRLAPSPVVKGEEHEDHCAICNQSGEVLMCDTCVLVYHMKCLTPPLSKIPSGMWMCPKCQEVCKQTEAMQWPGTLAIAHSYLKNTIVKDKEKEKLLIRNKELKKQELELQRKVNDLSNTIMTQIKKRKEIVESTRKTQSKIQQLKTFVDKVHSWR